MNLQLQLTTLKLYLHKIYMTQKNQRVKSNYVDHVGFFMHSLLKLNDMLTSPNPTL